MFSRKKIAPTRRRSLRSGIVAGVGVAALFLAGCAAAEPVSEADTETEAVEETVTVEASGPCEPVMVSSFGIATPETEADYGWNQMGIVGATETGASLGIEADINAGVGYDNSESILTQIVEKGNDFVIAHASGFATGGARVAEVTGTPVLVVDLDQLVECKVAAVLFDAHEGGYLAGVVAANTTETGTVGIVASAEDLNWFTMSGGFIQGAQSVTPDINIVIAYIGPAEYGDSAGGQRVANQVIAAGADVIFGMGDGATIGYLQAIETAATTVKYIATIGDVTEIDTTGSMLTSVLWNFGMAYEEAIGDLEAGTFGTKNYALNVANGGLSLANEGNLSADAKTAVDAAVSGISDGSIVVEKLTTKDDVQALLG
jgi:simple sugar transport system substrate-binding protein